MCNVETKDDNKPFNSGGLGRCSEPNAVSKIQRSRDLKIQDEGHKFHAAAKRLDVILSGASYDVFAVDVYYHKTSYVNFTYAYDRKLSSADAAEKETLVVEIMDTFFKLFHCMVIKDQNAYFVRELIDDIKEISEDYDLEDPPISKTCMLKKHLIEKFGEAFDFICLGTGWWSIPVQSTRYLILQLLFKEMDSTNLM